MADCSFSHSVWSVHIQNEAKRSRIKWDCQSKNHCVRNLHQSSTHVGKRCLMLLDIMCEAWKKNLAHSVKQLMQNNYLQGGITWQPKLVNVHLNWFSIHRCSLPWAALVTVEPRSSLLSTAFKCNCQMHPKGRNIFKEARSLTWSQFNSRWSGKSHNKQSSLTKKIK